MHFCKQIKILQQKLEPFVKSILRFKNNVFDYFKNVTLFRKHHSIVNMNQQALESMKYWEQRRNHGQYFLAYDIGKSAVRVLPNVKCTKKYKNAQTA